MRKFGRFKFLLTIITIFFIAFSSTHYSNALERIVFITVKLNGNVIKMDVLPYVKDNRTFVPVRFVAEALNANVEWIGEEKKVIITSEDKTIEMFQDSNELVVNGEKQLMDTVVEVLEGRTMVPVRFAAENLDCSVEWDEPTYSVLINKEGAVVPAANIQDRTYTDDDIIWLSRIVSVEGSGLSMDGKLAIANVVLNRKASPDFPDTVYDVIFAKGNSVQFPPAHKEGFNELLPSDDCIIAAKMALEGINNIDKCLYFNNAPFNSRSDKLYKIIDGEYFYY
ncbi:MAG: stalk domain-containing protein [Acetivibrionales bacterium]|jgi:N-acetylmuramoyl-L-alanine amidase